MKRSVAENIMIYIAVGIIGFIIMVLLSPVVYADNGHGHDHDESVTQVDVATGGVDVTTGGVEAGDVTVHTGGNKSRALALGNTLGDVDISQCLGSTQWSTPVYGKQKLVINWICVAEFYIKYQQPGLAAMALCNTEILMEFETEEECEQAHQFLAQAAVQNNLMEEQEDRDDERYEQTKAIQMELFHRVEALQEQIERAQSKPAARPQVQRVVEQKPLLTEDQKARLRQEVMK